MAIPFSKFQLIGCINDFKDSSYLKDLLSKGMAKKHFVKWVKLIVQKSSDVHKLLNHCNN